MRVIISTNGIKKLGNSSAGRSVVALSIMLNHSSLFSCQETVHNQSRHTPSNSFPSDQSSRKRQPHFQPYMFYAIGIIRRGGSSSIYRLLHIVSLAAGVMTPNGVGLSFSVVWGV